MNFKLIIFFFLYFVINNIIHHIQKINTIDVIGNDRISKDVIIMFSEVSRDLILILMT